MSDLIEHNCPSEGKMMIEAGRPCNWCDEFDKGIKMPIHSDKERLQVAQTMAEDFLNIYRACSYKEMTDTERDELNRIAEQARLVTGHTGDYNPEDDDKSFGC